MYLWANLEIDPSQITVIRRVENDEFLSKLLKVLTLGLSSEKIEQETFTVVSILQQIQMGLMRMEVNNVIRLAVDDYDYFFDENATEDDMHQAMFSIETEIEPLESQRFNKIELALEHHDENFKYIFDISILRKHRVGEYPIKITVNALFKEFEKRPKESIVKLRERMMKLFRSQYDYDAYVHKKQESFSSFISDMEDSLSKFIQIDGIKKEYIKKIIRPASKLTSDYKFQQNKETDPVFHGYPGIDRYVFYTMIWADACHKNDINCSNFILVDEKGNPILKSGNYGIHAGRNNLMNFEAEFEPAISKDVLYYSGSHYNDILLKNELISSIEDEEKMEITNFSKLKENKEN